MDGFSIRILGVAGSLRAGSFNRRLLEAASEAAPSGVHLDIHSELGSIPLFSEDLEGEDKSRPPSVARLRQAIEAADAVLISTPEYNQSMPGVLKNAIDWVSRPPRSSFDGKPVALVGITTGQWGTRLSQAALRQTLFACGAVLIQVPHLYLRDADKLFASGSLEFAATSQLTSLLAAIARQVVNNRLPA